MDRRAWIALEHKRIAYAPVEALKIGADQKYIKDPGLLAANPAGLVPTLTALDAAGNEDNARVVKESLLCVEFIDERQRYRSGGKWQVGIAERGDSRSQCRGC